MKEEADKLRQEEERAKQAALEEAQRLQREKQQAAQRERQAAMREEQEARARARVASEKAEAAAKAKAMAKLEKANKALRAKENRDRERDSKMQKDKEKEKKAGGGGGGSRVQLSIQEPGFGSARESRDAKIPQRVASGAVGGLGNAVSSPRGNFEDDTPSPTCPSTPLAGLSSLPLPPSMSTPPIGLRAASSTGREQVSPSGIAATQHGISSSSAATTGGTAASANGTAPGGIGSGKPARNGVSSTAWSPKDLHRETADPEAPLARLVVVGQGHGPTGQDGPGLGELEDDSEKEDGVLRGLGLDEVDSAEVSISGYADGSSAGSSIDLISSSAGSGSPAGPNHSSVHRSRGGWGSPDRQIGSPRFDHAIGSMWDDADPCPAPAPSAQPSLGAATPPRNAIETAAAWPTVGIESMNATGGQVSQSQSVLGSLAGITSSLSGQAQPVQSWATGRLVGASSSHSSPDGSSTAGRDLGEEELPDWLLSTLGEMGSDGITSQDISKDSGEILSSPVAEYLSQETPAGPRRSDLKLAGRRGPASPPHTTPASAGKTLGGSADSGDGQARLQQPVGAVGVSLSATGRVSPVHSVHWAPPGSFPAAPTNGWGVAAADKFDASSNGGTAGPSKGWTVGTHRAKIV